VCVCVGVWVCVLLPNNGTLSIFMIFQTNRIELIYGCLW
jgi:hypothetical protein